VRETINQTQRDVVSFVFNRGFASNGEAFMIDPVQLLTSMGVLDESARQVRFKSVLLLGAPGAGKGVQGSILKSIPGFYHFSSGEVFRRIDTSTKLGRLFIDYSKRGELVPDDMVIQMWLTNIQAHAVLGDFKPARHLLVLDGIPRTIPQAQMLNNYLDVLKVVHLQCSNMEAMVDRLRHRALKEGRPDDADEKVIRNRFVVYQRETQPLLDQYSADKIVNVDCLASPAQVAARILTVLAPLQELQQGTEPV
jgi:adenylate kinase